ncbi:Nitrate/nitrite response regulator protein NarL [Methyloligella halotolerans]|uniref:Nitrate/nitrite response regulator protein NarL n=1 Tax=Methyloligella halotolerans TaxID=1177755 RepID=A0A1E2RUJ6_9HYPH|nr:two-component system response regulator NarL [Methyloligella halotolerans]ODA65926.1 Nitrate/nitrite response regulator protein NarL [Methyloligella halotolerans]
MSQSSCRVLLVDDHPLFRRGVAELIAAEPDLEVVGEAASADEGIALASDLDPDLILMDLNMGDGSGLDALKTIKDSGLKARIIMLTVSENEADFLRAVRIGAGGYLLKGSEPEEILEKVRQAARGETVFAEPLMGLLVGALREGGTPPPPPSEECLTAREREILHLICAGKSNKHIARELNISDGTVKVHVKNLLRKLNLQSRLEAAVWALTAS